MARKTGVDCHWDERAKLVNVATRLTSRPGPTVPPQRASYVILTSALRQRFTPVNMFRAAGSTNGSRARRRV